MGTAGPFLVASIVPVAMFAAIFATLYFAIQAREKERLKLIEKGYDLSKLSSPNSGGSQWLRYGIAICSVAVGVLISRILDQWSVGFSDPVLFGILFGGLGMVLAWRVDRKVYPESDRPVEPIVPEFDPGETDEWAETINSPDSGEDTLREAMDDPEFEDRVMGVVHLMPAPARKRRTATLWQIFQAPVVRRVAMASFASVLLAMLLGTGGVEAVLSAVQSALEWSGQSLDVSLSEWGGAAAIHEWLSVSILLLVLWQLDQTMATVRHRVQPE